MAYGRGNPPQPMEVESELALIARAQTDPDALNQLLIRYTNPVLRYCLLRFRDQDEAEDVAQGILIAVYERFPTFKPRSETSFRAWVFRIAHNHKVDSIRRNARRTKLNAVSAVPEIDPEPTPEEVAIRNADRAQLLEMISKLNGDERDVLQLRAAGLETKEIASVLKLTESNVRKLQERAITRLRGAHADQIGDR